MTSSASNSSLSPRAAVTFTSIPGLNRAFGINADGLVVGDYGGNNIAGVWSGAEGFRSVGRLDGSTACCSALSAVNAAGVGVGFSHTDAGVSTEWSAAGGSIDLQIPGRTYAQDVNASGDVIASDYTGFTSPGQGERVAAGAASAREPVRRRRSPRDHRSAARRRHRLGAGRNGPGRGVARPRL